MPDARLLLPLTTGIALLLVALGSRTSLRRASRWFALLIVGQAASLRLVQAGTALHYQHLLPWNAVIGAEPVAALILAGEIVLVASALVARRSRLAEWFRQSLGWFRGSLLVAAIALAGATISPHAGSFLLEIVLATLIHATAMGTIVLAVAAVPESVVGRISQALDRLLDGGSGPLRPAVDRVAVVCAVAVTTTAALLSVVVYERHPHIQDEVAYLYQARYFAQGLLAMPPPAVPEAFELFLLDVGPAGWYGVFSPGWPLLLALGVSLGVPWLVNPALGGVNVLLAYIVVWQLYERRTARFVILLLSASPWFLYLGMSFMPHQATLTCLLIATWAVNRARETGLGRFTWIAGAAVGFLSHVRQLDAAVVAALLGLWVLGFGGRRLGYSATAGLILSTALVAGLAVPYNRVFTGDGLQFPMMTYFDRQFGTNSHAYGFGPDRGMGWGIDPFAGHGPVDALVNADLNTTAIDVELFGWATGSLGLVFLFLVGRTRRNRSDGLVLALGAGIFTAYFFNYFAGGPDFGARYWFLMIVPAVVLTVRGLDALAGSLAELTDHPRARVYGAALALSAAAVLVFVPWRALDKYHHYLGMRPDIRRLEAMHDFGRSLVLVRGAQFPDYASAVVYNPIDFRADAPIYVHDRGPFLYPKLRQAYGDRALWIVDGPSRTGAGFRVAAGPIAWPDLAAPVGQTFDPSIAHDRLQSR